MNDAQRQEWIKDLQQLHCEAALIRSIEQALALQHQEEVLHLLGICKQQLLLRLHRSQRQVDLIDFLLYQIRQEQKGGTK